MQEIVVRKSGADMSSSRQPSRRVSLGLSRAFLHSLARWTTQTSLHWHELGEDLHSRHAGVKLDALTMENTNTMKLLRRGAMGQMIRCCLAHAHSIEFS